MAISKFCLDDFLGMEPLGRGTNCPPVFWSLKRAQENLTSFIMSYYTSPSGHPLAMLEKENKEKTGDGSVLPIKKVIFLVVQGGGL